MPFGIPSEDFHGGFGIPEDEVCVINYDDTDGDISDEEYDQIAEDAHNEKVHALIEASIEISELRADCKKMLDRMMLTTAALSIALREYRGPYKKELKQSHQEAEDLCAYMYNLYGEKGE